ncbi:MAG: DUF6338 family protein [Pseudomonadota bacterium]
MVAQIAVIFLPGLIWATLDEKYVSGNRSSQPNKLIKAFLFGMFTYAVLYLLYGWMGWAFSVEGFELQGSRLLSTEFLDEILLSVPLSVTLAIIWMYLQNYRLFMRVLHWLRATQRFGDQDVWTFTLNSSLPHVEYVNIRMFETGFTYSGWVNSFSENEDMREILLKDAYIYNVEGDQVGRVPHIYLAFPKDDVVVEFPYTENEEFYRDNKDT